jgi:YesN/AraC family two-component response regulator
MPKAKILVVDDEIDVREALSNFLSKKIDCEVEEAPNGEEALKKLKKDKFDLVILDIKMPGLSGIDVMKEAAKFTPETKILAVSGYDSHEVAEEALRSGAYDYMHKPQSTEGIELKVKDILTKINKYAPKTS